MTHTPTDLVDHTIGPYHLERLLGQGGFAWLFVGRELDGTPVAVKILKPRGTLRRSRAATICSASLRGTRGSFMPWTTNSGLVTRSALLRGALRSIQARVVESRSSPYSTRRRSWR